MEVPSHQRWESMKLGPSHGPQKWPEWRDHCTSLCMEAAEQPRPWLWHSSLFFVDWKRLLSLPLANAASIGKCCTVRKDTHHAWMDFTGACGNFTAEQGAQFDILQADGKALQAKQTREEERRDAERAWGCGGSTVSSSEPQLKREERTRDPGYKSPPMHPMETFILHKTTYIAPFCDLLLVMNCAACLGVPFKPFLFLLCPVNQTSLHPRPCHTSPDLLLPFPAAAFPFFS